MLTARGTRAFAAAFVERVFKASGLAMLLIVVCPWVGLCVRAEDAPRRVLMLHAYNYYVSCALIFGTSIAPDQSACSLPRDRQRLNS